MLSEEQIRAIALLPADQDFRFTTEYGKTVVVVPKLRGTLFIEEDGRLFYVSDSGATQSWKTETCLLGGTDERDDRTSATFMGGAGKGG